MEMNITKTKRAGILIITHGSSDLNADLSFSDLLYAELKEKYPEALVCQAYSAPKTLQRIDRDRTRTPLLNREESKYCRRSYDAVRRTAPSKGSDGGERLVVCHAQRSRA